MKSKKTGKELVYDMLTVIVNNDELVANIIADYANCEGCPFASECTDDEITTKRKRCIDKIKQKIKEVY